MFDHEASDEAIGPAFHESAKFVEGRGTTSGIERNSDAASAVALLHSALDEQELDLTLGMADSSLAVPSARSKISRKTIARVLGELKVKVSDVAEQQLVGVLDGANYRTGKVEIGLADDSEPIHCDTPAASRHVLVNKVIGRRYLFSLNRVID